MKTLRHIKIVQFFIPVTTILLHRRTNLVINALAFEPHNKAGNRILLWQSRRFENNTQKRQSDAAACAGSQCAGRGVKPAISFGLRTQLFKTVPDALWQVGNATRRSAVRKNRINPKRTKHLDKMRFTGTIKSAYPDCGLLCLVDIFEVCLKDM